MDARATIDAVRDATETERDRLGSDKALVAATGASLETDAVLEAAATREAGLAAALGRWSDEISDDDGADGAVADALDEAAAAAAERSDRIDADSGEPDALSAHLETVAGTAERVGAGLVAAPLIADRFYLQVVNFFVNEADEGRADLARELRSDASSLDQAETALDALSESERDAAAAAATEAVEAAYEGYAEALDAMGLDPKPIC
ncbi:transcription antitermination protein [Haloarcula salina]|uniref:Transcription antitermination protein n=1 Tax=Haloarcula salina TaxID=1429914 RepID=A0AA41G4V5_9EURY|nr:transcription antitermination protein [Haloarcula salina]MBV0903646.1 transcription antitermination protein [Haloarcula salina]